MNKDDPIMKHLESQDAYYRENDREQDTSGTSFEERLETGEGPREQ